MIYRFLFVLSLGALAISGTMAGESPMKVVVDILVKPKITITDQGTKRSYPESQKNQRTVWEPWAMFYYRVGETHLVTGDDAGELLAFLRAQISDKKPTGWSGHEADYAITLIRGEKILLRTTLSAQSGSCVYVESNAAVIGHFHPTERILALLGNKQAGEQGGAYDPATTPQLESSGNVNPNPESKPRPQ